MANDCAKNVALRQTARNHRSRDWFGETRDENVIQNDMEIFAGVATFHETSERACVNQVKTLLVRKERNR